MANGALLGDFTFSVFTIYITCMVETGYVLLLALTFSNKLGVKVNM